MTSPANRGPSAVPNWVLTFNDLIERSWLMLKVNVMWTALTVLGLVVLGAAPATCAAADAYVSGRDGDRIRVFPTMWRSYRTQFVRVNLRMVPLMVVQFAASAMLWFVFLGAEPSHAPVLFAAIGAISLAWTTVSLASIVAIPRLRRQDLVVTWRIALLMPGALPGRAIVLVLLLAIWATVSSTIWPVGALLGAAVAVDLAVWLLGRRGERLLRDIDSELEAPAT